MTSRGSWPARTAPRSSRIWVPALQRSRAPTAGTRRAVGAAQGGESATFLALNRNKRGMTLNQDRGGRADPAQDGGRGGCAGRELPRRNDGAAKPRLRGALRHQPAARLLLRLRFRRDGALRDEAGYEAIMQAYSGVMSVTGEPEGDPVRCGLSFIDLTTGIISAYAVLEPCSTASGRARGRRSRPRC